MKGVLKRENVDQHFPDFHMPVSHRHLVKMVILIQWVGGEAMILHFQQVPWRG